MPTYEYRCPKCNTEQLRGCLSDKRDSQFCECGAKLARRGIPTGLRVVVPGSFAYSASDFEPTTDKEREIVRKYHVPKHSAANPGSAYSLAAAAKAVGA